MRKRILAICPTPWEKAAMNSPRLRDRYEFVACCEDLADSISIWRALRFDVFKYLRDISDRYAGQNIQGVLGTGDYPGCMFGAVIAETLGLPSPRARDIVLLSHKVHSREIQRRVVPEATPAFEHLDPLALKQPQTLTYPFFVKPVKGTMSIRAQMVHDRSQLRSALSIRWREMLRGWILLRPFEQMLRAYTDVQIPIWAFIAEAPLYGHQVTVDGFVQGRQVTIMGIVDSIMYPGTISFQRFEYPSSLPEAIQKRMIDVATRLIEGSGLDHACFNIEMFYDPRIDEVSIIEINPRMSYQFSDMYERVDGMSTFAVQLALATGEPVGWRAGAGEDRVAASFVMRRFSDGRVLAVPQPHHLAEFERLFPDGHVEVLCKPGERLSDQFQDTKSFRYCIVNLAAPSRDMLYARYAEAVRLLPFQFADP